MSLSMANKADQMNISGTNLQYLFYYTQGLTENVTLNGDILTNWKHTGFPLDNVSHIPGLSVIEEVKQPAFYSGRFQLPENLSTPLDTFINMSGWTKVNQYRYARIQKLLACATLTAKY